MIWRIHARPQHKEGNSLESVWHIASRDPSAAPRRYYHNYYIIRRICTQRQAQHLQHLTLRFLRLKGGCVCSTACTRLLRLEAEATSLSGDVQYEEGSMSRTRKREPLKTSYFTIRAFRCSIADFTCLRAVVQLPRLTPEAYPPGTDPPVKFGRQVWRFNDGASQVGEGGCLAALLPSGVEDYLRYRRTYNRHAHGLHLALRDGQTKCAEDFDEDRHHPLQPARRPRQDTRVISLQHPPNSTPRTFQCRFRANI